MPKVTYDQKSFLIDDRRIWLVSGAIHYSRTPRSQWRQRLAAAREAGLNCIETYVFWNLHEPASGEFNFEGDNDLRAFVQMIGEAGMYCILRPGPYVCAEWENGGLPAWLSLEKGMKLREANEPFLKYCSRYLGKVLEQVQDLQITSPASGNNKQQSTFNHLGKVAGGYPGAGKNGGGGPIILMQAENEWMCHNPEQGEKYLYPMVRYLRENGCQVPINVCNQLLQRVEGTIDTWNSSADLFASLRQLGVVQPDAPRLVTEYWPGWFDAWGGKHSNAVDGQKHLYRLASILAAGGQYNMYMFHGGTNFGFYGGRTVNGSPSQFMTTSYDYDAPLLEAGGRADKYETTKRISTFASQFGNVLANLDPKANHTAAALNELDHPLSIIHNRGSAGEAVFLFKSAQDNCQSVEVLLPEGLSLPVDMGQDRAAWLLLNTNLGPVAGAGDDADNPTVATATLDYTNLRPWAFLEQKMLVLFGPSASKGVISINKAPLEIDVPKGDKPAIEHHQGLTIVVMNERQIDASYLCEKGVGVWVCGLDEQGNPVVKPGKKKSVVISVDGHIQTLNTASIQKPSAPKLNQWSYRSTQSFVDGTAKEYQTIDGPASLEKLGQNLGYGWYRIPIAQAGQSKIISPGAQDRLHIYHQSKLKRIAGEGPGAVEAPVTFSANGQIVALVDNLGRFNYGTRTGEQKGILDHLYKVDPIKLDKPQVVDHLSGDYFALVGYALRKRRGDRRPSKALEWTLKPAKRKPIIFELRDFPTDGVLFVNDKQVQNYQQHAACNRLQVVIDPKDEHVSGGKNQIKLILDEPLDQKIDPLKYVYAYQITANLTSRGKWGFCPWHVPTGNQPFEKLPKKTTGQPGWFKTSFSIKTKNKPLWLEPKGMSKGQIFINGHNSGRYWVNTAGGKKVTPQEKYYLPESWLKEEGPNELLLFDEHGKSPTSARLVYDEMGPYN